MIEQVIIEETDLDVDGILETSEESVGKPPAMGPLDEFQAQTQAALDRNSDKINRLTEELKHLK